MGYNIITLKQQKEKTMSSQAVTQQEKIEELDVNKLTVKQSKEIASGICEFFWSMHLESKKSLKESEWLDRYGNVDYNQASLYMRVRKQIFNYSDRCVKEVMTLLEECAEK